jgi:undecaprenyl diphosphate synthase
MYYPKHVAIIPDGNRTRAKENNVSIPEAYWISYQKGVDLLEYTFDHTDVQVFTLRGLSTENTAKRPQEEYDFLMNMYKQVDSKLDEILERNQINFKWIGNPAGVTDGFKNYLNEKSKKFNYPTNKRFVFAVNYGGRDEITRGIQKLAQEGKDLTKITEEDITTALDLGNIPPIELVIRTKGDQAQRTSGFMSWWIGYAELFFTAKRCPELDIPLYQEALTWFDQMAEKRNFGK